ncbi:hypothetical protein TcasGA2_TC033707 [Tribolium castaneum]|uniref:Uncharacterized protein n=1 Tax=Tribolium castaneum TaxID=7070 RepID=A0A139WEC9_TRICA|nr:hypothetical protein TcasGA2_TC033707 [Tribolium castaneum]
MAKVLLFFTLVVAFTSLCVCRPMESPTRPRRYISELEPPRGEVIQDTLKYPDHTFIFVPFFSVRRYYEYKRRLV